MRCARCPAPAYTRTPHLPGRAAALCRDCADAFERERRGPCLCEECAARPASLEVERRELCERCALRLERERASFRAASHTWLTLRVARVMHAVPIWADPWSDERW